MSRRWILGYTEGPRINSLKNIRECPPSRVMNMYQNGQIPPLKISFLLRIGVF